MMYSKGVKAMISGTLKVRAHQLGGVLFVDVMIGRALLFGIYIRLSNFFETQISFRGSARARAPGM